MAIGAISLLSGCVPADGPLTKAVIAGRSEGPARRAEPTLVFDIVQIDGRVASALQSTDRPSLAGTFDTDREPVPVIGVGDELDITIFESGADGLFSTEKRKSSQMTTVIQPDGYGQIPFAGRVRFAGKTLETARHDIRRALAGKAIEPDVVVRLKDNPSRVVSVQGEVNRPRMVTLGPMSQPLSAVIAAAGGVRRAPYDTLVTVTRGTRSSSVWLQSVLDHPQEDISIHPGDRIFLAHQPRTFTAMGAVIHGGKLPFGTAALTITEASARAGGVASDRADPTGYFIFRYETEPNYRKAVGDRRFEDLLRMGMIVSRDGRYPVVYRIDMSEPTSLLIGQNFFLRDGDVFYVSHHPASDFSKFVTMVQGPVRIAKQVQVMRNQ